MADSTLRMDHIGSLIRPQKLLDARAEWKAGKLSRDDLRRVEDDAIEETLAIQRNAGIEIYTDGELRRDSYMTHLYEAVDGFQKEYPIREEKLPDGTIQRVELHGKPVVGKLRSKGRIAKDETEYMLSHSPGRFKITQHSPAQAFGWQPSEAYPTIDACRDDMTAIVRDELVALAAQGVKYLQMDEGLSGGFVREGWYDQQVAAGNDPDKLLEAAIASENLCWDSLPDTVIKGTHICRGNRVRVGGKGGYDWVAENAFGRLHVDRYLLEYDSERAGGFEPLRFVPKGKIVVLGLISTKTPEMETVDGLRRRIDEASKYLPVDQLALSPQCGFQSAANPDGAFMTMDDQKRKLELLAETTRKVWG